MPTLVWKPREEWGNGCSVLDTPWAATAEEKENAVEGVVRAFGAEPSFLRLGIPRRDGGMVGIYGPDGKAVAGYSVSIQSGEPCGRIASLKFSRSGDLGAHLLETLETPQRFFRGKAQASRTLFQAPPAFEWSPASMRGQTVNDMWFSETAVAADVSGTILLGDTTTGAATPAMELPGAEPGDYYDAEVSGPDVFVGRRVDGRSEWWLWREGRLEPFLRKTDRDIRELVTDGTTLVWVEGRDPAPPSATSPEPVQFQRYSVMKAPYTTRSTELTPETLLADVPRDFGHLVLANGFATGIYLISYPVYRAGAIVMDLSARTARRSELPQGYSWGYELYPTPLALWGPVTSGPMLTFETVARVPYEAMPIIQNP